MTMLDHESQFILVFMNELCKLTRVKQKLLTVYHSQTDNNIEILNQYINQRLRLFINHFQDNWLILLSVMNFAQTTLTHKSMNMFSFKLELDYTSCIQFD